MKKILVPSIILSFLIGSFSQSALHPIEVVTPDGKKVILRPDKTWEFVLEKPPSNVPTSPIVGDDPNTVLSLAKSYYKELEKSEFETDLQFQVRIRELLKSIEVPKTKHRLDNVILVFEDLDKYDADLQRFEFPIGLLDLFTINSRKSSDPIVSFVSRERGRWTSFRSFDRLFVEMSPNRAKDVKPNLRLAVYGMAVDSSYGLSILPTKFVAFNIATHEVYAELLIESSQLTSKPYSRPTATPKPLATPPPKNAKP